MISGKPYKNKIRSSTKEIENIKKNQTNFGAEEYIDCTEEFNEELQKQTWPSRMKNQWAWKQVSWIYSIRGEREKEWMELRKPAGFMGYH